MVSIPIVPSIAVSDLSSYTPLREFLRARVYWFFVW